MRSFFRSFRDREDGAVTVDWVIITAAVTGLAAVSYVLIQNGSEGLAEDVEAALSDEAITISTGDSDSAVGGILTGGSSN